MTDPLAQKIRAARDGVGLTQEEMARLVGVSLRTLTRYESGETQEIASRRLIAIARVTRKPLSYFLGRVAA